MKALSIVMSGNQTSEDGYDTLKKSSKDVGNQFQILRSPAYLPDEVDGVMSEENLKWTWPNRGVEKDEKTGIIKRAYSTRVPNKRKACCLSHYFLWKMCYSTGEDFLILEHDAKFTQKLDLELLQNSERLAIGLNDPANATRLIGKYDDIVKKARKENTPAIIDVPVIDKPETAQGFAGNSAYYLKPAGAKLFLDTVHDIGLWPNDATICWQLFGEKIGVSTEYYTKVQGLPSTTSL